MRVCALEHQRFI
jgi:hypothetical protein